MELQTASGEVEIFARDGEKKWRARKRDRKQIVECIEAMFVIVLFCCGNLLWDGLYIYYYEYLYAKPFEFKYVESTSMSANKHVDVDMPLIICFFVIPQ